MAWAQLTRGGPAAGVEATVWRPSIWSGGPLAILDHDTAAVYHPPGMHRDLLHLADSGVCVVAVDCPGWGNADARARVDDTISWAATELGADTDVGVVLIGDSRGATTSLNWAWRLVDPDRLAGLVLRVPAVDLAGLYERDFDGIAAELDAAWPGGFSAGDPSDPANIDAQAAIADKVRTWYSTDDPIVLPAEVTAWSDATGIRLTSYGAVGHSPWDAGATPWISQTLYCWRRFNAQ